MQIRFEWKIQKSNTDLFPNPTVILNLIMADNVSTQMPQNKVF